MAARPAPNGPSASAAYPATQAPKYSRRAGARSNGPASYKPVAAQWFIFTFVVNGATSYLRINGGQTGSASFGANSVDGITLGSIYNGLGNWSDMDLGEFRLASRALTPTEVSDEEIYFAGKYGITL